MNLRPIAAFALLAALAGLPTHASQRAFVSSTGSDANLCTPTGPCRSFAAAHSVVDPGGEIVALDAAGYGALTVTKSVTIVGNPGVFAGIAGKDVVSGAGINIGTAGLIVVLRGLTLNGDGTGVGVLMTQSSTVHIENCVISNYSIGMRGFGSVDTASVEIVDSLFRNNSTAVQMDKGASATISGSRLIGGITGVFAQSSPAGVFTVSINNTVIAGGGIGIFAGASGSTGGGLRLSVTNSTLANNSEGVRAFSAFTDPVTVTLGSSSIVDNATGVNNLGGTNVTVNSTGNNVIQLNGTNVSGTLGSVTLN
jgi:hypothetical protein